MMLGVALLLWPRLLQALPQHPAAPTLDLGNHSAAAFGSTRSLNLTVDSPDAAPMGPDVSHWQGTINWQKVKSGGYGFAIAKATEGSGATDSQFKANWKGIAAAGIKVRGAYHFGHPGSDASAQAHHFASFVGPLKKGDFAVLDIETSDKVSPAKVASWCKQFVDTVQQLMGLPPGRVWVYTGAWFWNPQAGGSSAVGNHPLWVSGYVKTAPPMPKGWSSWTTWQYTDRAKVPGISGGVDMSRFKGTQATLQHLVGL